MGDRPHREESDAKKNALADLEKLRKIMDGMKARLQTKEEEILLAAKNTIVNRCWWDTKPCQYYSEIRGFQEARDLCNGCWRVDRKRFIFILEETVPDFTQCLRDEEEAAKEAIEKGAKAEMEETWQEIHEEILGVIAEFEEEN